MTELLTSGQIWTKQLVVHKHPVRPPFGKAHRSPKRGYDTPVKAQWRTSVWENLIRHLPPDVRGNSSAFIVDTTDALEIDKALSLGFTEEHLHVCNVNPAIVATLKRRYPGINTYGVEAEAALNRALDDGLRFDVISLDLCGPVSARTHDVLHSARAAINGQGSVGLTVMRGREPKEITLDIPGTRNDRANWTAVIRSMFNVRSDFDAAVSSSSDVMRFGAPLLHLLFGPCHWITGRGGRTEVSVQAERTEWLTGCIRSGGRYTSGQVSMLWMCFGVVQPISMAPSGFDVSAPADGWSREWVGNRTVRSNIWRHGSSGFKAPLRV